MVVIVCDCDCVCQYSIAGYQEAQGDEAGSLKVCVVRIFTFHVCPGVLRKRQYDTETHILVHVHDHTIKFYNTGTLIRTLIHTHTRTVAPEGGQARKRNCSIRAVTQV